MNILRPRQRLIRSLDIINNLLRFTVNSQHCNSNTHLLTTVGSSILIKKILLLCFSLPVLLLLLKSQPSESQFHLIFSTSCIQKSLTYDFCDYWTPWARPRNKATTPAPNSSINTKTLSPMALSSLHSFGSSGQHHFGALKVDYEHRTWAEGRYLPDKGMAEYDRQALANNLDLQNTQVRTPFLPPIFIEF